jgi:hypothetical protein
MVIADMFPPPSEILWPKRVYGSLLNTAKTWFPTPGKKKDFLNNAPS